jgi:hypothetical protein
MKQRTELGETIELMEATEEDESESESESDEESVWETTSIDENENPDSNEEEETKPNGCYVGSIWVPDECPKCGYKPEKCDCTSYETDSEKDEPEKMDECKKCGEYSYLIQQLKEKDHKITILNDIIERQDKQIEEADEENDSDEEKKWEAEYYGLEEWVNNFMEEKKEEEAKNKKIIKDYAKRVNELIDEVKTLRNKTTNNV